MSYGRDDTGHRGMSDQALSDERLAQRIVTDVIDACRRQARSRTKGAERVGAVALLSTVRPDQLLDFSRKLNDEELDLANVLHDYAPDFTQWDEAIKEARES